MSVFSILNIGNLSFTNFKNEKETYKTIVRNGSELNKENDLYNPSPCSYSIDPTEESKYGRENIVFNHIGDIENVWNQYRGDNVLVSVIDTGVDIRHDEFWIDGKCIVSNKSVYMYSEQYTNNIIKESCGDNYENEQCLRPTDAHGTGVAAVIAATATGNGIVGVAPNASILAIKVQFTVNIICEAIKYSVDCGADVINMSLGQEEVTPSIIDSYQSAINYAYSKGCIVCSAAGNNSTNALFYPASLEHVVGVGALGVNAEAAKADYSNYNVYGRSTNNVDFVTPGSVYTATDVTDGVSLYSETYTSGTSFATPVMSGAAALYKQKYPTANQDDFYGALLASSTDIGAAGWDEIFGHGRLDVAKLLDADEVKETSNPTTTKTEDSTNIYWEDQIGWNFRTLHIYNLSYYQGYQEKDFESFLTIYASGEASDRNSWTFEGTSRKWCFNVENRHGDYLIKPGGSTQTHNIQLPWWVTKAEYQFVNNTKWFPESNKPTVDIDIGRYHKDLKSYIYNSNNNPALSYVIGDSSTYAFKAVKVTRKVTTAKGTQMWSDTSYKTCVYDYMPVPEPHEIAGYRFIGWYLDSGFVKPYKERIVKNDMTLYGLVVPVNGRYYAPNIWSEDDLFAYEFYYVGDAMIEPLGTWPGTKMTKVEGVTYADNNLYYVDITTNSDAKIVLNDGFNNKMGGFPATKSYVATHTTSWSYGSTGVPAVELIIDICNALKEVESGGSVKQGSVCGLGPVAGGFIDEYKALSTEARSRFDAATLYTYKKDKTDGYEDVSFYDIITQLSGESYHIVLSNIIDVNDKGYSNLTIIVLAGVTMSFIAAAYMRKKKRPVIKQ